MSWHYLWCRTKFLWRVWRTRKGRAERIAALEAALWPPLPQIRVWTTELQEAKMRAQAIELKRQMNGYAMYGSSGMTFLEKEEARRHAIYQRIAVEEKRKLRAMGAI